MFVSILYHLLFVSKKVINFTQPYYEETFKKISANALNLMKQIGNRLALKLQYFQKNTICYVSKELTK